MGLCFSLPFWPDEAGNPAIANAETLQNLAFSGLSFRYPPGLKHPRGEKEPRPDLIDADAGLAGSIAPFFAPWVGT